MVETELITAGNLREQVQGMCGSAILHADDVVNATMFVLSTLPHCQVTETYLIFNSH